MGFPMVLLVRLWRWVKLHGSLVTTALVCLLFIACRDSSNGPRTETNLPEGIPIRLVPAYASGITEYALEEASTRVPMVADITAMGLGHLFREVRIASGGQSLQLGRITSAASFQVELISATGSVQTITVRTEPPDFPSYTTSMTGTAAEGDIYTGTFQGIEAVSYNLILGSDLNPVYYRRFAHGVFNFHKLSYADGTTRYAFIECPSAPLKGVGYGEGDVVLLDQDFRELRRVRLLPHGDHGSIPAENHDFLFFDDDHYVLSAYYERILDLRDYEGKVDSHVVASILQEVDKGAVVWEWDSTDYPAFYESSVEHKDYLNQDPNRPVADYMHFNSMDYDPFDKGYILSFRHQDALMKILPFEARNPDGTIQIKWILGGIWDKFGLTEDQRFFRQHMARIVSRTGSTLRLSLFNNNNGHYADHHSSVMLFDLDEGTKQAVLVDEYDDAMDSLAMGSAQVLGPNHYFVGWGTINQITEIKDGAPVFTLDFADGINVYRAFKIP